MNEARARIILRCLRRAASPDGGPTDGQLLGRYVARRDDDAFAALARRHGPMVLAVCRRVLRNEADAEDAFQAAFLVLARKAASVRAASGGGAGTVAGWLYKVAYHAALETRAAALRRKAREQQMEHVPHPIVLPEEGRDEMLGLLDRELARLPEKYRLPVVLCELEGRSRKEAASQLGLPEGTLSSRLATARKTLAARLSGGGAAVSAAALGAVFAGGARAACLPGRLLVSAVRVAGGVAPAGVAAITEGVMKSMLLTKLKATAWGLLLAASLSVGAVALTYRPAAAQPTPAGQPPAAANAAASDRDELEALRLEVEALRLELKATKERVKALEDRAQAPKETNIVGANNSEPGNQYPDGKKAPPPSPAPKPSPTNLVPRDGVAPPGTAPAPKGPDEEYSQPPGNQYTPPAPDLKGRPDAETDSKGQPDADRSPQPPGSPVTATPTKDGKFPGGFITDSPKVDEKGVAEPPAKDAPDPAAEAEAALETLRQRPDAQALEALDRAVQQLKERGGQPPPSSIRLDGKK